MDRVEFEKLVKETLVNLPKKFKKALDNVEIVVEEWPNIQVARGRLLLGLYQGVPKITWGRGLATTLPDKISIFKGPIEFWARGDKDLTKKLVRDTVKHEIAHHFGISDARLDQIYR